MTKDELIVAIASLMIRERKMIEQKRDSNFIPSTTEDLELYEKQYSNWLRLFRVEQLQDMFMDKLMKLAGE
jgi:hypothetical protein